MLWLELELWPHWQLLESWFFSFWLNQNLIVILEWECWLFHQYVVVFVWLFVYFLNFLFFFFRFKACRMLACVGWTWTFSCIQRFVFHSFLSSVSHPALSIFFLFVGPWTKKEKLLNFPTEFFSCNYFFNQNHFKQSNLLQQQFQKN